MGEISAPGPAAELPPVEYPGGSFETFKELVLVAADAAYARAAEEKQQPVEVVHTTQACGTVSRELHDELETVGIATNYKGVPWLMWALHYHLNTGISTPEPVIVDATWQQFLPEPDPAKPSVIVIPESQVAEALTELGIPQDRHYLWLAAVPMLRPEKRPQDRI